MLRYRYDSDDALRDDYEARGWTDGLPIIAPTPERVDAMLGAAQLDSEEVLGAVATRDVIVRAGDAAVNAVMAGCLPSYFGVVVAATRAHLHEMPTATRPRGRYRAPCRS